MLEAWEEPAHGGGRLFDDSHAASARDGFEERPGALMDSEAFVDFGLLRRREAWNPVEVFWGSPHFGAAGAEFESGEFLARRGQDDEAYEAARPEAEERMEASIVEDVTGGVELHVIRGEAIHP